MYRSLINKSIIVVAVIISAIFFWVYSFKSNTLHGDALGYYLYLPATFIYHDLKRPDQVPKDTTIPFYIYYGLADRGAHKSSKGFMINQYTYGVAFMEMPFFFIAHAYEKAVGLPANGYSANYQLSLKTATLFYGLLGLILVYKILKRYFTPSLSLLGTVIIFLCTNLFWFIVYQAGMSHTPIFFLYALLMLLTIRVHENPKTALFLSIGFVAGLITIIRPTDILCILIPLLYNVYNRETIKQKIQLIRSNSKNMLALVIAFITPIIPQLLYWKVITGNYFYYSYEEQTFFWSHPKIIEGLFYFSNGWLPYAPIMIFAVAGMFLYKRIKTWAWCIWLIFPLYVYIIYSWYCYNYINGLGSRPMIHLYPLLAIPLTAFIQLVSKQKIWVRSLFAILCVFFMAMNISYSMLQARKLLFSENSNMQFNFQMLFRMQLRYNDLVVKDLAELQPDSNTLQKISTITCSDFEDSTSPHYVHDTVYGSKFVYHMTPDETYVNTEAPIIYNKEKFNGAKWFKCSGRFMYPFPTTENYIKHLIVLNIEKKLWKGCEIENKIGDWKNNIIPDIMLNRNEPGKWGYVYFYTKIPEGLVDGDVIKLFIWNMPQRDLYIDNFCLEIYR